MPRKYDYDAIIASYKELQSKRAVADLLNVPRMTVHQVLQRASGQCVRCKALIEPGKNSCEKCKDYDSARMKIKRKERFRAGLCQDCDNPYDPPSRTYCTKHRLLHQKASSKHKKNMKNEQKLHISYQAKLYNITQKYGQNGVDCYNESNGYCETCGRQQGEVSICIHHINCDETDHRRDNLTCLCNDCHIIIHGILRAKDPGSLLNWTISTYEDILHKFFED